MNLITNYLLIKKIRSEVDPIAKSIDPSYRLNMSSVMYDIVRRTNLYISKKRNWAHVIEDYKEGGEHARMYVLVLMYTLLTHNTGGTKFGYAGELNGNGREILRIAAVMSQRLTDYGYFDNEQAAKKDWEDFVEYLKKTT